MISKLSDFCAGMMDNPINAGIFAGVVAMVYFFMMTLSPILPPAMLFSLVVGYFVYRLRAGTSQENTPKANPVSANPESKQPNSGKPNAQNKNKKLSPVN